MEKLLYYIYLFICLYLHKRGNEKVKLLKYFKNLGDEISVFSLEGDILVGELSKGQKNK